MDKKTPPEADQPTSLEKEKSNKAEKIFFILFSALIAIVVTITFCKYFILKDYYIEAQADCDPESENCFIWECDPASTEEGEKCTGDPETDIWYYKNVKKKAFDIPLCDPNTDENCEALICHMGEDCQETLCDESNVEEGGECNDPVEYLEENPPEDEEGEECAPDDEECLAAEEECAPDDKECLESEESAEECAPDDEECLKAEESDSEGAGTSEEETGKTEDSGQESSAPNFLDFAV